MKYDNIKRKAEQLVGEKYSEFRTLLKEFDTYVDEFGQDATDEQLLRKFNERGLVKWCGCDTRSH